MKRVRRLHDVHDEMTIAAAIMREQSYRHFTTRLCTEARMTKELSRNRSSLTSLHFITATFGSESTAREAYEQLVIDDLPFTECGGTLTHHVTTAEEAQRSLSLERLAFQKPNEVHPPTKSAAAWQLHHLIDRIPPSLSNPEVRARCASALQTSQLRDA
jgi:hypothetical protein